MITKVVSRGGREVLIGDGGPTVVVGERINPFGKGAVKEGIISGNMDAIREEARKQVEAGSDILIVSVGAFGVDEEVMLPMVAEAVMDAVDVPLCLESRNPTALESTLQKGCGIPIISSVTGDVAVLDRLLPLVQKYRTPFVALASDESGIPNTAGKRLATITYIVEKAREAGIGAENVIADCVAESSAVNKNGALMTLETIRMVKDRLGLNVILGASNVSFGLPNRVAINAVFISLAIEAGLTCAIVNAEKMKPYIMATDLLMARDPMARRYTAYSRKLKNTPPR
jgi:5-methyltetrahydrofolate--homocysteine methyltransferase